MEKSVQSFFFCIRPMAPAPAHSRTRGRPGSQSRGRHSAHQASSAHSSQYPGAGSQEGSKNNRFTDFSSVLNFEHFWRYSVVIVQAVLIEPPKKPCRIFFFNIFYNLNYEKISFMNGKIRFYITLPYKSEFQNEVKQTNM